MLSAASSVHALSISEARHLLARTGFDPSWREIEPLLPLSRQQAVNQILAKASSAPITPIPAHILNAPGESYLAYLAKPEAEQKAQQQLERERVEELQVWWLNQMVKTPTPLAEQMLLFWHNHFTSAINKVRTARLMARQHQTLRQHAIGNFAQLLHAMSRDPALLRYLDSASNRKDQPNENFARELLELFTLGEGQYAEEDVQAAARAFSGWMVNSEQGSFRFNERQHDASQKTFLGQTGTFNGNDIIDLLLVHPQTARHLTRKLWQHFISDTPDEQEVHLLASQWQKTWDIKALLRSLFLTEAFWAPQNRGNLIKSPTDYVVGLARVWQLPVREGNKWHHATFQLGQDLFNPPNVKGWDGGTAWITTDTLLKRQQLIHRFVREADGMKARRLPETWNQATEELWKLVLLPLPPADSPDGTPAQQLEAWLLDPVFQVK